MFNGITAQGDAMDLPFGLDHILVACVCLLLIGELRRALWQGVVGWVKRPGLALVADQNARHSIRAMALQHGTQTNQDGAPGKFPQHGCANLAPP